MLLVGRLMGQKIFSEGDVINVDTFTITRISRDEKDENYNVKRVHRYVFDEVTQ
jgi:hypothetical protein